MSVTSVNGSTIGADQLVQQIVDAVDTNHDGQVSNSEFATFLTSLVSRMSPGNTGSNSPLASVAQGTDIPPSQWTSNNAPYGVTLAGFSPQDHTDLTLADLGVPGRAEKYAVYEYLVANRVQPTSDWAPAAAAALNAKYNTTVYHAIDGETLGWGNEFCHSAPNGHGMAPGTYNPLATGELLWGYV